MPGSSVERKQASIEVSVTQPYMIITTLGGIRSPRIEEQVTRAVAKPWDIPVQSYVGSL